jgi:hypothetical protein
MQEILQLWQWLSCTGANFRGHIKQLGWWMSGNTSIHQTLNCNKTYIYILTEVGRAIVHAVLASHCSGLHSHPCHVRFVVTKAALGQAFTEYSGVPCKSFHQVFHTLIQGGLCELCNNVDSDWWLDLFALKRLQPRQIAVTPGNTALVVPWILLGVPYDLHFLAGLSLLPSAFITGTVTGTE